MSSEYGKNLKISIFGESHGKAIGVNINGLPSGEEINQDELLKFMERRAPGKSKLTTHRREPDVPVFLSGIKDGKTCGSPICAIIENQDMRSGDYSGFTDTPRPSHADYTALLRYGEGCDMRGSGHFSGRLTAPLCIAGGIALQILARKNIFIGAHIASIGNINDSPFPLHPTKELFNEISSRTPSVIDTKAGEMMESETEKAASECDSVGGIIECAVIGMPAGIGDPMFEGIENRISQAIFGIPAVKGIEFGKGFESARSYGSQNNDPFIINDGKIETSTNNSGGIIGGISNGMPIVFRAAFKPTPSIAKPQQTVNLKTMTEEEIVIKGRHDPCVAIRAVPVIEAVTATVILDMLLGGY